MSDDAPRSPLAAGVLLRALVDDAATFPPGNAPMADAVESRAMYEDSWFAGVLGAVVLRSDRAGELLAALRATGLHARTSREPLPVTVVAPGGPGTVAEALAEVRDPGLRVVSVEVPLGPGRPDATALRATRALLPAGADLYVEPSTGLDPAEVMPVLAQAGVRGKIRTGGTTSAAFPDEATVARFVHEAVAAGVPFKATAGLHNALRHRDEDTGFEHHGFVNLLAATAAARLHGASEHQVHVLLRARDAEPLLDLLGVLDVSQAAQVREAFVSFGSCSTVEPVEDLAGLGLLVRPAVGVGA
ncbi:hypothetical protein [Jannaschia sp. R86511]|uniref:hypothetical protein n=1 Tax=Jannaschia sp. R86511 TaxID=3093853 RepID=UPI0036D27561